MACYHPIECWRSNEGRDPASGKWKLVFKINDSMPGYPSLKIACGGCIGCRLDKARDWAIRCVHEAKLHNKNVFLTLTYSNENVIKQCGVYDEKENRISQLSLNKVDFVLFMKRLRKWYYNEYKKKIRFFHCGEYGDLYGRPHHHVCVFGLDFEDKRIIRDGQVKLYISPTLNKLWKYGYSTIGDVTFDSAAYVAKYVTKKIYGEMSDEWYNGIEPEYQTMSRRPGIGKMWFEKFNRDVYGMDKMVVINKEKVLTLRPPKYYDYLYDKVEPEKLKELKIERRLKARDRKADNTVERLQAKEERMSLKMKQRLRNYERSD